MKYDIIGYFKGYWALLRMQNGEYYQVPFSKENFVNQVNKIKRYKYARTLMNYTQGVEDGSNMPLYLKPLIDRNLKEMEIEKNIIG